MQMIQPLCIHFMHFVQGTHEILRFRHKRSKLWCAYIHPTPNWHAIKMYSGGVQIWSLHTENKLCR